ncbi:hypothetical protein CgIS1_01015 [Frankia sp. CgS1]|nr:hypothetical protein CgIS1_01015 [Frankia sp. CgIS1]
MAAARSVSGSDVAVWEAGLDRGPGSVRRGGGAPTAGFATKPLLALDMIRRFWLAHRELGWVAGDEVYGANAELRDWLEEQMIPFSSNEIRHVLALFGQAAIPAAMITWWSDWRRRHQARARLYHFQTRIRANQSAVARAATT